jgi:hypothetical protein
MPKDKVNNPEGKNQYTGAGGAGQKYKYSVGGYFATKAKQSVLDYDADLSKLNADILKDTATFYKEQFGSVDPRLEKYRTEGKEVLKAFPEEPPETKFEGYTEKTTKADYARAVGSTAVLGVVGGPAGVLVGAAVSAGLISRKAKNIENANQHLMDAQAQSEKLRQEISERRRVAKSDIKFVEDIENERLKIIRDADKAYLDSLSKANAKASAAAQYRAVSDTKTYASGHAKQTAGEVKAKVSEIKNTVHSFFNRATKKK